MDYPIKVLQFGTGGFLRGFCDYFLEILNQKGRFNGSVAIVNNMPSSGAMKKLKDRKGKYNVRFEGYVNGNEYTENCKINCISRVVDYYEDREEYLSLVKSDDLQLVISNTTETGIAFDENDTQEALDKTFPAKLTDLLYVRYKHFCGKGGGLYILPTELIDDNADVLLGYVLDYAKLWKLSDDFSKWLKEECFFCNTLVDRITPGFPKKNIEDYFSEIGESDPLLVVGEPYALWAVQEKGELRQILNSDLKQIVLCKEVKPYKVRKVRLLNAVHTSFVHYGYALGYDVVKECLKDEDIVGRIKTIMFDEIIPTISCLPKGELEEFANSVLDRFGNPFLEHSLLQITLYSIQKWKVRLLPIVKDFYEKFQKLPKNAVYSLNFIYNFYSNGKFEGESYFAENFGRRYKIMDEKYVLDFFSKNPTLKEFLDNTEFWGEPLTAIPGFYELCKESK